MSVWKSAPSSVSNNWRKPLAETTTATATIVVEPVKFYYGGGGSRRVCGTFVAGGLVYDGEIALAPTGFIVDGTKYYSLAAPPANIRGLHLGVVECESNRYHITVPAPPPAVSPPVVLEDHVTAGGTRVRVVRDDLLPGGTKQRAAAALEKIPQEKIVYACTSVGFSQMALAVCCKLVGKQAVIVSDHTNCAIPIRAKMYGASYVRAPGGLQELQKVAADVAAESDSYVLPFDFDMEDFQAELAEKLAVAAHDCGIDGKTVWLAAGGTTLVSVLCKIFPQSRFNVVQIGKRIWPDQVDSSRVTIYVADEYFGHRAAAPPPYPSVATCDAKVWSHVEKHAADGDIVWNSAGFI